MALTKLNSRSATALDATVLTGNLPAISGASLTGISGGKVLQTQTALFTSQTAHNSETYSATGYTDQITPSATNSKILVTFNFRHHIYQSGGTGCLCRLAVFRQINGGGYSQFYPTDANIGGGFSEADSNEKTWYTIGNMVFMDTTHNTTNAIDYKLYARRDTSSSGSVNVGGSSHQAQVILMEIGA